MRGKVLELLINSDEFISGQKISDICGVSRTSIWKHINSLKEEGYGIESIPSKGYKLISSPDLLTYEEIDRYRDTKYIGREINHFDSIDSTNNYANHIAFDKDEGAMVTAEEQKSGKGRLGRSWTSPASKGIYSSIILKPQLEPSQVAKLTLIGAAAVHLGLKDEDIYSQIKWPNDIVINGKKVCGILTEMSCELNIINHIIIGIGINANLDEDDFSQDLKDKGTSLKIVTGNTVRRNKLLALVLNHFERLYDSFKENLDLTETIKVCRENSALIGKEVQIIKDGAPRLGRALDINDDGELLVEFTDGIERIYSGEVSLRGVGRYI